MARHGISWHNPRITAACTHMVSLWPFRLPPGSRVIAGQAVIYSPATLCLCVEKRIAQIWRSTLPIIRDGIGFTRLVAEESKRQLD